MRKISQLQLEQIIAVSNEGLTKFPPAALEKDIFLTEALKAITKNEYYDSSELNIIFGGGTSLIKAFPIISRMSEDLDFKIVFKPSEERNATKRFLGDVKRSLTETLRNQGFDLGELVARNSNKYFRFDIPYESSFNPLVSLRPEIKMEFTVSKTPLPTQTREIETLLTRHISNKELPNIEFECVHPAQTAAEKLISLCRGVEKIMNGQDEQLIRHIYDLHQLSKFGLETDDVKRALSSAIDEDSTRFKSDFPDDLKSDPSKYLRQGFDKLLKFPKLDALYTSFVMVLVSGEAVELDEAKRSLDQLLSKI